MGAEWRFAAAVVYVRLGRSGVKFADQTAGLLSQVSSASASAIETHVGDLELQGGLHCCGLCAFSLIFPLNNVWGAQYVLAPREVQGQ